MSLQKNPIYRLRFQCINPTLSWSWRFLRKSSGTHKIKHNTSGWKIFSALIQMLYFPVTVTANSQFALIRF